MTQIIKKFSMSVLVVGILTGCGGGATNSADETKDVIQRLKGEWTNKDSNSGNIKGCVNDITSGTSTLNIYKITDIDFINITKTFSEIDCPSDKIDLDLEVKYRYKLDVTNYETTKDGTRMYSFDLEYLSYLVHSGSYDPAYIDKNNSYGIIGKNSKYLLLIGDSDDKKSRDDIKKTIPLLNDDNKAIGKFIKK